MKQLYTPEEVAQICQLHAETVRRRLRDGRLKGVRVGRSWRIRQEELDQFVEHGDANAEVELRICSMPTVMH